MNKWAPSLGISLFVCICVALVSQRAFAQFFDNQTIPSGVDSLLTLGKSPAYESSFDLVTVRVFVHSICLTDGSGGRTEAEVDSLLHEASSVLISDGITFYDVGFEEIHNSAFYSDPLLNFSSLIQISPHSDSIDLFIGPDVGSPQGVAEGVPGISGLVTGDFNGFGPIVQVLGNCLGLYCTDETVFGVEASDGNNSAYSGDLVQDTSADPGLDGYVLSDCSIDPSFFSAHPGFSPDPENFMANTQVACMARFSEGQVKRILSALENLSLLQTVYRSGPPASTYIDLTSDTQLDQMTNYPDFASGAAGFNFYGDSQKDFVRLCVDDENQSFPIMLVK